MLKGFGDSMELTGYLEGKTLYLIGYTPTSLMFSLYTVVNMFEGFLMSEKIVTDEIGVLATLS